MWTELFMMNKEALIAEIDVLAKNLTAYADALRAEDRDELYRLLQEGSDLKEWQVAQQAASQSKK